ncbi:hypothetical protein ACFPFV_07835 [Salinicoccus siamensis]
MPMIVKINLSESFYFSLKYMGHAGHLQLTMASPALSRYPYN